MAPSNSALGSDDVAKPKKVRNERRPCHCYKCKGQLRDRHTVKKHAEESERINAPGLEKVLLGESSSKKRKRNKVKEDEKGPEDDSMDVDVRGSRSGAEDGNELNELEVVAGPPAGGLDIGGEMKSGQPDEGTQDGGLGGEPLEKVDNSIQEQIGMDIEMDPRPASSIFGEAGQPDGKNGGRRSPSPLNWSPSGDFMDGEYEDAPPDSRSPSPGPDDDLDSGGPGDVDPTAEDDNLPTPEPSVIETIRFSDELIELIRNASLDNDKLTDDMRTALRNPVQGPYPELTDAERVSLTLYLDCDGASQSVYEAVRRTFQDENPDKYPEGLLSHYRVEKLMERITGIVSVEDDMCIGGCRAYVGPWEGDKVCPCGVDRFHPVKEGSKKAAVPKQQMTTLPLGFQIQAFRRSGPGSVAMGYRARKVKQIIEDLGKGEQIVLDDIFSGSDYLKLHQEANITEDDTVLGFTIDGAQLYQDKKSDAWIAAWVIYDYDPATRYKRKHVLPALIIPGPEKPKNLDSFLFRSFYHLSALQRENNGRGLRVWDHSKQAVVYSRTFFLFGLADAVGLTELDGRVGHHGAVGCRLGCPMKGRHKPGQGHYYAAHKCPTVPIDPNKGVASNHADFDYGDIRRPTPEEYEADVQKVRASATLDAYTTNRKDTGISKPSIISALVPELSFSASNCTTVDLMHHFYNNIPVLFIAHWRGTIKCEPTDSKQDWFWVCLTGENWTSHGLDVENAGQYLPSLFHRIPRNPALKISSSYKCTEYNVYFYKLGRVFFRKYLPKVVWQHYCLLVHAVDILSQRSITREQLIEAHEALVAFVRGYEDLYYQGREDRLHFCRGAIHTLLHTSPEAFRVGPGAYVTQYTLEGLIGDLGAEIRQPSNPFGNLKKIALRRCQMNAAKVIYPHLDPDSKIQPPRGSRPLDGGYVLLTPKAPSLKATSRLGAMGTLIQKELGMLHILQWGRLMLPNGQYSRSHFVESRCTRLTRRVSRMVKIERAAPSVNGLPGPKITEFAEVQFFFLTSQEEPKAMVSVFGPRVERLYTESHSTIWACKFPKPQDTQHLRICDVSEIVTVVSMQPFVKCDEDTDLDDDLWFVAEKSGLDDPSLYLTLEALNRHLSQDAV